jgi:AAA domain
MPVSREEAKRAADEALRRAKAQRQSGPPEASPYTLLRDLKPNLISNDIVRDLIPCGALGEAFAASGDGKTAIIVDLGLHIAAGREYRGRRVIQQPVVYVALEGHGGVGNRIIAAAAELGLEDVPFALIKSSDSFRDPAAAAKVAAVAKELLATFGGDCPVVMIDTFMAALGAGGSDCDPKDVSAFIAHVKAALLMPGFTCIVIHRAGKDASRGARGWSGLLAALDFELEVDRDGDLRTMRVTKMRDGSDAQPAFCYRFGARELGKNQYGDPVTAVVIEHLADEVTTKRGKRHSPKARAALNALWEMIKDKSRSFPMADQPGLRCVIMSEWEKECVDPARGISKCAQERDRRSKFRMAKAELEAAKAIVAEGENAGRVYPSPGPQRDRRDE